MPAPFLGRFGIEEQRPLYEALERASATRQQVAAQARALREQLDTQKEIATKQIEWNQKQQDWEQVKFGIEQETMRIQAQAKAGAPMTVGLEQAVYLPGEDRFRIPKLTYPEIIDPGPESADIIVTNPNTGQEIGRLKKNLVADGEIITDMFNIWVIDKNTGDIMSRYINPKGELLYELEVIKANNPVTVALINKAADVAVAGTVADSKLAQILSDEKIVIWGIASAEKIEEAKAVISAGMLVVAQGQLQLNDRAVTLLDLREHEKIKVNKFLALHHDDIIETLGEKGIEVQIEGLAVEREKIVVDTYEAETNRLSAEWVRDGREETAELLRLEGESKDRFREAQGATATEKNRLYEISINNDLKVNLLRINSLNKLNAATTKATLAGIPRDDRLYVLKETIANKDMWYKDQLVRIEDLRVTLEELELAWNEAEGADKLILKGLVDRASTNLMNAQTDAARAETELAKDNAEYVRERNTILDSKEVRWNATWEKMLRGEFLSEAEKVLLGMPKATYIPETMDDVLTLYKKKQEILAKHAPWNPSTWEEKQKVLKYEASLEAALGLMSDAQKIEYDKAKALINQETTKKKIGLETEAKKEIIEYEEKFKLGRKDKENLFERYAKAAASIARPGLMGGAFAPEERQYAASLFIAMVQTDRDLTDAEKAHFISWASIIMGEGPELSKLITGETPMVALPGEGLSFTSFVSILNEAFTGRGEGAPAAPLTTPVAPKKVKGASASEIKKFVDSYVKKNPNATKEEVREAVRKRFGE